VFGSATCVNTAKIQAIPNNQLQVIAGANVRAKKFQIKI
jgi:hypothetical protein